MENKNFTLLFDLDNTIYPEIQFLRLVFKRISNLYKNSSNEVENFLNEEFTASGRLNLYNKLLLKFPNADLKLDDIINVHKIRIEKNYLKPFPWFQNYIISLRPSIRIITNGNIIQQRNKIYSLDIQKYCSYFEVVFANAFKPKPSPDSFFELKNYSDLENPVYIGNEKSDEIFSENCGIKYLDVNEITNDSFFLKL